MQEMLRSLALILVFMSPIGGANADEMPAPRPLASAIHAADRGDWERADQLAARDGPAARTLIEWMRLRAGRGTAAEVSAFLSDHAHWPGLGLLRRKSESAFQEVDDATVLAFYKDNPPQTGEAVLRYAAALRASGESGEAQASLVLAWRTMALSAGAHQAFVDNFADLLGPHHAARLDMALWRGMGDEVALMLPLVSKEQRQLAAARRAVQKGADDSGSLIAALPKALKGDAGLAHDQFMKLVSSSSTEDAATFMQKHSSSAESLGQPQRWASWRRYLARALMREDKPDDAYRLAMTHQLTKGADFADLEWLAGYIALQKLNDPTLALVHFTRFRETVDSPISLGRAGYWLGRAFEALDEKSAAASAYGLGAQHQTSFYGLLAAEKAGVPPDPALRGVEYFPAWQQAAFAQSDLVDVIELALAMNRLSLAEQFILHLAQDQGRTGLGQLGNMAEDLGAPHLAVMLGKQGAGRGITLPGIYYPLHMMTEMDLPVPMEMALSIARRESEFDPGVASSVGAMGLMQLMPGTASDVARDLGLEHERARVLNDWRYNATLGSAYLAELVRQFGGNVVMVSAGYNAGPRRPIRWMEQYGDPRQGGMDVIDWIEHIPFRETQNYVMRVAESLPVYRARLGKDPHPIPFSQELVGSSLLPKGE